MSGSDCDAWLLHYQSEDGLAYAATWNAWLSNSDPQAFAASLDRWTSHYERSGIHALATGAITLRQREAGKPWWRADHMDSGPEGSDGQQVARVFAAQDRLAVASDDGLLDTVPRFAGNQRLDQRMRLRDGAWSIESTRIVLDDGAGVAADVDARALASILAIDGETPLREIVAEATEELPDADAASLTSAILANIRHLAGLGIATIDAPASPG